jgi:Protein of unknown function (DUF3306)
MPTFAAAVSGEHQMDEVEKFVSRWSRRKRASNLKGDLRQDTASSVTATPDSSNVGHDAAASQDLSVPTFDLASLPSIGSITAATDIRSFLQSAVPVELARAALRQAWVSDPLIRDFVGIAENQWDFTNPTTIPGFGPLPQAANETAGVARAVEAPGQVSTARPTGATSAEAAAPGSDSRRDAAQETVGDERSTLAAPTSDKEASVSGPGSSRSEETTMYKSSRENPGTEHPRRVHGGALPR